METKTKADRYILEQVQPLLLAGEVVSACAALSARRASPSCLAALTNQRLLLIQTRTGAFGPLLENKGLVEIPRSLITGVCFDPVLMIELADGNVLEFLASRSTRNVSTQLQFLDELRAIGPSATLAKAAGAQKKFNKTAALIGIALAGVVVATLALSGCAMEAVRGNPRPNIALQEAATKTLKLHLSPEVAPQLELEGQSGIRAVNVQQWHETLQTGFDNGFRDYFKITQGGTSDLTIELRRTDVAFLPDEGQKMDSDSGIVLFRAHITYKARLVDAAGKVVKVSANTIKAKKGVLYRWECTDTLASAVETMYETIAKDVF